MFRLHNLARTIFTLLVIGAVLLAIHALWIRYQVVPLTRDGKVRADVVPVAADVAGLITDVRVRDNQMVRKDDVLLVLDRPRYKIALHQAEANVGNSRVALAEAVREDRRNRSMPDVIATEVIEQGSARVGQLRMALAEAESARDLARLNLDRTVLRAPVDGMVSNMTLQPGVFLPAGKAAVALVYLRSLRVEGYFEETKLPAVNIGDPASVHLMGVAGEIRGHVESMSPGVEDRERTGGDAQLPNVNPSFTWVRLAQRIPVRVAIDRIPPGIRLVPGQTATVEIHPRASDPQAKRSFPW
jgi:RND family efflux transporter MFP subunit